MSTRDCIERSVATLLRSDCLKLFQWNATTNLFEPMTHARTLEDTAPFQTALRKALKAKELPNAGLLLNF